MDFHADRPLILDNTGRPRAAVLVHNSTGLTVTGVIGQTVTDEVLAPLSLLAESTLPAVVEQRKARAVELLGADPAAVGVRAWSLDDDRLKLHLDPLPLSHWVASRTVFAGLTPDAKLEHTLRADRGFDPLFGTHLGYTATVVTADNQLVCIRRTGKLLADGMSDSAIGDTALLADLVDGRWSAHDALITAGRKFLGLHPEDFRSLTVALLGIRVDDSGLWVSGHAHLRLTADELLAAVVEHSDFPAASRLRFVPWGMSAARHALADGEWTSWGMADLASAVSIDFGVPIAL